MQRLSSTYLLVWVILLITGYCPVAFAADLHVGPGQAYTTIASGISASSNGDTIIIHAGTYHEHLLRPKSGNDNAHRTLLTKADGEDRPVIDGDGHCVFDLTAIQYVTLEELNITDGGDGEAGAITIGNDTYNGESSYITIDHCKVYDTNVGGDTRSNPGQIRIGYGGNGSHIIISNCELTGGVADGIIACTDSSFSDITIKNNYIHDTVYGIHFKWGDNTDRNIVVKYNKISDVSSHPIGFDQSYVDCNNNIFDSNSGLLKFGDNWNGNYCQVVHNTIYKSSGTVFYFQSGNNNTIKDNIYYPATGIEDYSGDPNTFTNNYTTDPLWVNPAISDFHLQSGSGARNNATDGTDQGADVDNSVGPTTGSVPGTPGGFLYIAHDSL